MARRVNTKFLVILSVVVAGLAVGLIALKMLNLGARSSKSYMDSAEKAMDEHEAHLKANDKAAALADLKAAADAYVEALKLDSKNLDLYMKLSEVRAQLFLTDADHRQFNDPSTNWIKPLDDLIVIDNQYLPALTRRFDEYVDLWDVTSRTAQAERVRYAEMLQNAASALEQPATGDLKAKAHAYAQLAIVGKWLATGAGDVPSEDTLKALAAYGIDTGDRRVIASAVDGYLSLIKVRTGATLFEAPAAALRNKAIGVYESACAKHPDDPALAFNYALLLQVMNGAVKADQTKEDYSARVKDLFTVADKVPVSNPLYADITTYRAHRKLEENKRKEAVDMMKAAYAAKPGAETQIALGELYNALAGYHVSELENDAIILLSAETPQDASLVGFKAMRRQLFEQNRLIALSRAYLNRVKTIQLNSARLDQDEVAKATKEIDGFLAKADDAYARAVAEGAPEAAPAMEVLKARRQMLNSNGAQSLEAIHLLQDAYNNTNGGGSIQSLEITDELASAYIAHGENGPAKVYLQQLVNAQPSYLPARLRLLNILMNESDREGALKQLDAIDKLSPNLTIALANRLLLLDRVKDKEEMRRVFDKIGEANAAQMSVKARIAATVGYLPEAAALLTRVLASPDRKAYLVDSSIFLAKIYAYDKKIPEAKKVIDSALAEKAGDPQLTLIQKQLGNETQEQIATWLKTYVDGQGQDPIQALLNKINLARQSGDKEELATQMALAEKMARDDGRVQVQLLAYYLDNKDWDKAQKCVDGLTRSNFGQTHGREFQVALLTRRADASPETGGKLLQEAASIAAKWVQEQPENSDAAFNLAMVQKAMQQYAAASENFEKVYRAKLTNPEPLVGLIQCDYALNKPQFAKTHIEEGRKRFPGDSRFVELDVGHEELYGDPAKSTNVREKVLSAQLSAVPANTKPGPQVLSAYLQLQRNYQLCALHAVKENDTAAAVDYRKKQQATLEKAQSLWPDDLQVVGSLAELATLRGDSAAAVKAVKSLEAEKSAWKGKPQASQMLAATYRALRDWPNAEAQYKEAIERSKAQAGGQPDLAIMLELAKFYAYTGQQGVKENLAKAVEQYVAVADLSKYEPDKLLLKKFAINFAMQIGAANHDVAQAEKYLEPELKAHPEDPDLLALEGFKIMTAGKSVPERAPAREWFDKALRIDPNNGVALFHRAVMYADAGKWDLARADLARCKDIDPNSIETRRVLALVFDQLGQPASAREELEQAMRINPLAVEVRIMLLEMIAKYDSSRAHYIEILQDAINNPQLSHMAVWYQLLGSALGDEHPPQQVAPPFTYTRLTEAGEALRRAMALDPKSPSIRFAYVEVLLRQKGYDEAAKQLDDMVLLVPGTDKWLYFVQRARAVQRGAAEANPEALTLFGEALSDEYAADDAVAARILGRIMETVPFEATVKFCEEQSAAKPAIRIMLAMLYNARADFVKAKATIDTLLADHAAFNALTELSKVAAHRTNFVVYYDAAKAATNPTEWDATVKAGTDFLAFLNTLPAAGDTPARQQRILIAKVPILNNLAWILINNVPQKNPPLALNYAQEAYRSVPFNASIADTYGWVLFQNGKVADAKPVLEKAAGADAGAANGGAASPEIHYHLAMVYSHEAVPEMDAARSQLALALNRLNLLESPSGAGKNPQLRQEIVNEGKRIDDVVSKGQGASAN